MNYLVEINAFHERQDTNPLSVNARSLWHVLMQVNNRSRWVPVFSVAVSVLCAKANLSESAFKRARIELAEKGYIYYRSRSGRQAAQYEMISAADYVGQDADVTTLAPESLVEDEEPVKETAKVSEKVADKGSVLVKQTKQNKITETTTAAQEFFAKNVGNINPFVAQAIKDAVAECGEDLVLEAMRRTAERGKTSWGYVQAILTSWRTKGLKTLAEVEAEAADFTAQAPTGKQRRPRAVGRPEIVPDWFHHRGKQASSAPAAVADGPDLATLMALYQSS